MLANAFLEEGLPGHELKAEPVVDHGKAPADKAGNAGEAPTDMLAGICWQVGEAALSRHLVADTFNLPPLKSRHCVDRDKNDAILSGRKAHLDKPPGATADGSVDFSAETAVPDFQSDPPQ